MFSYDQQVQMANAWTKALADATATAMQAQAALWGLAKPADPARSWYKAPAVANPFDWMSWMAPTPQMQGPWTALAETFSPQFGFRPIPGAADPWAALASFASTMSAMQPVREFWSAFLPQTSNGLPQAFVWQSMMWPMAAQLGAMTAAAGGQTAFASYRSNGGHAAAQITFAPAGDDNRISKLH